MNFLAVVLDGSLDPPFPRGDFSFRSFVLAPVLSPMNGKSLYLVHSVVPVVFPFFPPFGSASTFPFLRLREAKHHDHAILRACHAVANLVTVTELAPFFKMPQGSHCLTSVLHLLPLT